MTWFEFLSWLHFLDQDEQRHTKQDVYLATVAAEMRRSYVKKPQAVKVKDFLLSYEKGPQMPEPLTPKERIRRSKAAWLVGVGLKKVKL